MRADLEKRRALLQQHAESLATSNALSSYKGHVKTGTQHTYESSKVGDETLKKFNMMNMQDETSQLFELPENRNTNQSYIHNMSRQGSAADNSYIKGLKLRGDTVVSSGRDNILQNNISKVFQENSQV